MSHHSGYGRDDAPASAPGHFQYSYKDLSARVSALSLDWSPTGDGTKTPADPAEWFNKHLAGRKLAILDTGANMLAAANPINQFLQGLLGVAKSKGARIVVFAVTSPNKAGSDELVEMIYDRFRRGGEVMVVQNDRDGSRSFKSAAPLGTTVIGVPHLQPGLQAVRLRRRIPLAEVLTKPEPQFEGATALIAKSLLPVASHEAIIELVGPEPIDRLRALASAAPAETMYRISDLEQAGNVSLNLNQNLAVAWRKFRGANQQHATSFLDASTALWEAESAWRSRHR